MGKELKISVIIPIYGVEKYLAQCIESVIKQTYRDLEIVLVDDGSKDKSSQICDEYAKRDSRIKVIHKLNGGLSDARNCGIKNVTGEYILFLDGDDYWKSLKAVEDLVKRVKITKADVINFSYVKFDDETKKQIPYFNNVDSMPLKYLNDKKLQLKYLMDNNLFIASACNKMIKTSLLIDELFFTRGVYSEDIEWCAKLIKYAKSFDFVYMNFYMYRQHNDSIRHMISDKKCIDLKDNIIKCFLIAESIDPKYKKYIYNYIAFQYGTFFKVQAQVEKYQKVCVMELKEYKWILKYHGNNKKVFILWIMCNFIGYSNLCKIIRRFI